MIDNDTWESQLNPESEILLESALVDPTILSSFPSLGTGDHFQLERLGYFVVDKDSRNLPGDSGDDGEEKKVEGSSSDSSSDSRVHLVLNRTIPLRDTKQPKKKG